MVDFREGIYINRDLPDGKHELYTGFIVYYYKKLKIAPFTACTLEWVIEHMAKPKIH